jgi:hypothetical protein
VLVVVVLVVVVLVVVVLVVVVLVVVVLVVVVLVVVPQPVPTQPWFIWPAIRVNGVLGDILRTFVVHAPLKVEVKTASPLPFPLLSVVMVSVPDNFVPVMV